MNPKDTLIELDARRRTSFGRIGRPEHSKYLATEYPNGDVLLRPAVVISEEEARFLSDPALVTTVERRRKPGRPTVTRRY
jgi:hypothetical protein